MTQGIAKARESSELFKIPMPDDAHLHTLRDRLSSAVGMMPASDTPDGDSPATGTEIPIAADTAVAPANFGGTAAMLSTETPSDPLPATILVIDDEPVVIKLVRVYLAPLGIQVLGGSSLEEARSFAPQVCGVLCDVHLRAGSGIAIVRQLRWEGFDGPIIMISSDCSRSTVADSIEAGIVDFILKPFAREALIEKLRKHLALQFDSQPVG